MKKTGEVKSKKSTRVCTQSEYGLISCKRSTRVCTQSEYGLISCKRSQITIFVILAIIVVAAILALAYLNRTTIINILNPIKDPKDYIDKCSNDAAEKAFESVISVGGFVNTQSYYNYNGVKVAYFCYTPFNRQICTNKHPVLKKEIEKELYNLILPEVEKCFANLGQKYADYDYKEEPLNFSLEIAPGKIKLNINKKITIAKNDEIKIYKNFDTSINSAAYDFISLSVKIINDEVSCDCPSEACGADLVKLSLDNNKYVISKPVYTSNGEKVYVIEEYSTGNKFNFAVRNCVKK